MRTLEKGFGNCSLRTSTLICLAVISVIGVLSILGIFLGYGFETTLFTKILAFLYQTPVTAVFIYTLYTLLKDESSMLQIALIVLCVDIAFTVLGIITSIFTHILSLFIALIFILIYLAFKCYAAWILYSYWIDFKPPVSVSA
ncbi:uncharacterized protein LOC135834644 [Planococcus citri]|uniref:uncharacterized protein LOC135834644 n=1 Tax=Planococcus citri TaxID=170843 RepID=UPI0031F9109A